jgi:hypothetical protein
VSNKKDVQLTGAERMARVRELKKMMCLVPMRFVIHRRPRQRLAAMARADGLTLAGMVDKLVREAVAIRAG